MNQSHKTQAELVAEIEAAKSEVTIGAVYCHYKNRDKRYQVINLGFHEATDEICVIYQAQYGEQLTFIRPLKVWLEHIEWHGKTVARFTRL